VPVHAAPPPQPQPAVELLQSMSFPSHTRGIGGYIGPGWETEELRQRFRDEKAREQEQTAANFARMTKEQEERINREERERIAGSN
jgi:hypothetical protein